MDRFDLGVGIAFRLSDVTIAIVVLLWVFQKLIRKDIDIVTNNRLFIPILLFILTCVISLLVNIWSYSIQPLLISSLYLFRWIIYSALFYIVSEFKPAVKNYTLKLLIMSQLFLIILGFIQYLFYPNLRNLFYLGWDDHLYRLFSTFLDPNFFATQLNLFFILLLSIFLSTKSAHLKRNILYIVMLIVTFAALLLTYSRSGYLMFFIGTTIALWLLNKKKVIVFLFLLLLIGILALPKDLHSSGVELWRVASINARSESAKQALIIIRDNPVFGVGFNTYRYVQKKYGFIEEKTWDTNHAGAGTDNSFLFVFATTGIFGLLAFLYLGNVVIMHTWKKFMHNQGIEKGFAVAFIASVAGLSINSFFINSLFYPPVMFWMWLLLGLNQEK